MKLRNTLTSAMTIGLLATSATVVAAQTEESPSGTFFSGTVSFEELESTGGWQFGMLPDALCPNGEPANLVVNDVEYGMLVETTDPRISGVMDAAISSLSCVEDDWFTASTFAAEYRLTNDEGSWTGDGVGYIARELDFGDPRSAGFMHRFTGEGAYEGLTAIMLRQRNQFNEDGPPTHQVNGVIVAGDLPPASDFEGSTDLTQGLIEDDRFAYMTGEDEGDEEGQEMSDLSGSLRDVLDEATASLDGVRNEGVVLMGTMDEFVGDEAQAAKVDADLSLLGLTPDQLELYWFMMANAGEDEFLFQGAVYHFPGVGADQLREVMHPDNGNFLTDPEGAPNPAEELSYGGETVYAIWDRGAPVYWYTGDEMIIHLVSTQGPGSAPDEAAVEAYFTALLGPAD